MGELKASGFSSSSPPTVDIALDAIEATEIEREVVHLACKVYGARCALRVVKEYRAARQQSNQPMVRI
jgi:hypothetical protein